MTREQAIHYLERIKQEYDCSYEEDALDMAIQALEQQSMPTIALPDIDKKVESYKELLKHPVIKHIMDMDETQEQIDFVQPHKRIPVTLTVSGDLISRQAAVDAIQHAFDRETLLNSFVRKVAVDALKTMPSIKPQEPTGHWIDTGSGQICSECGEIQHGYDSFRRFCASCGAKMDLKGESNDGM